ncbi:unnamed protein product [Penicillium salamii]|nr:unnamed protein product [Penicillium salamii]CAG8361809.1 unnamed protein product [Penicillium salamii]
MSSRRNRRPRGKPANRGGSDSPKHRNQSAEICKQFQRGKCHYGDKCKFLHNGTKAADSSSTSVAHHLTTDNPDARKQYFDWKRLIRNGSSGRGLPGWENTELLEFWNGAFEILEGTSTEYHQFLAQDLVSDELHGFEFIKTTTDVDNSQELSTSSCDETFLKVITHPSLLNCLSVDSFVGTLYTSFGGVNGERAIHYLHRICRNLMGTGRDSSQGAPVVSLNTVKLLLDALYQLLLRFRRARFHDELPALLSLTRDLASKITDECSKADLDGLESKTDVMLSLVNSVNRKLATSSVSEGSQQQTGPVLSSFPMDIQIPGGRHDNDLADISQIEILPTHAEIMFGDSEYLPSTNFLQPHFLADPLQRYVDSTFRLLRHDIFGSAKDVLRDLLQQDHKNRVPSLLGKDSGANVYTTANVQQIFINQKNELEATVSFSPPPQLRKLSVKEQCRWWQDSSRLEEGSLVCFSTLQEAHRRIIFLEVTVKNASKEQENRYKSCLASDTSPPSITVKLAVCQQQELMFLSQIYSQRLTGILVDFHGMLPATFVPILKNLQRIHREGELSFQNWILPGSKNGRDDQSIPPPAYARKPGFSFPLKSITKPGADNAALDPADPKAIDIMKLQVETGLDHGQCRGLIAALTREYALIQGPPGTGKSYLGVKVVQALLETKERANIGPIIVICYTNHALDQFLKHLLDVGIEKILRIGGRSQAAELEGKNLRVVSKDIGKTRVESQTLGMSYGAIDETMKSAGYCMKPLHQSKKGLTWNAIESFLRRKLPRIHNQLQQEDKDGFKTVEKDRLLSWLGVKSMNTPKGPKDDEVDETRFRELMRAAERDIHSLSKSERRILATRWFDQWQENETGSLFEAISEAENLRKDINAVHEEINRRALIQADVVGITTTALARHNETLRRIGAKVIICEEAAEVMEAHVISALMPGVEHFIQIGDHRQLRPQIQNHSLSLESSTGKQWQLDRSQFERRAMGEPGLKPAPVAQLNVQRRMRPEISQLIRTVYPKLEDHESVSSLPNVVGIRQNLYWLDHRCNEDSGDDGSRVRSHSNQWDVEMATALIRHIVRQGEYKSSDIALLTPYTGQLRKLRTSLSRDFEICLSERDAEALAAEELAFNDSEAPQLVGHKTIEKKILLQTLRLATVDNFQGEEAKVIVVSLVRSNLKRKVGFLRTENRINVLLSRAQHGMYLIGNTDTYVNVPMWADVHSKLASASAVGTELALCCPRHPETAILCSEPHDFERKSPEGGCALPCTRRLEPCGHQCQATCHSAMMHDGFPCGKPCPRIRTSCRHECPKLCGEKCGLCMVKLHKVELPCGHIKKTLFCHQMSNLSLIHCDFMVEKTVPKCGHTIKVSCFKDVTTPGFRCPEPCANVFTCGHMCSGICADCLLTVLDGKKLFEHAVCEKLCDRPRGVCNHRCSRKCHEGKDCGSCEAKCEVQCSHSKCDSTCGKACAPCIERCTWSCTHQGSCSMPCAAPCDRLPCNERCAKFLKCGHQCPSLCGEDCPDKLCQACGDKGDARVDLLEWKTYAEINLDETPIIVLGCGHFFTSESVDGLVGLDEVYTRDKHGNFDGIRNSSSLANAIPSCPDCKQPIRQFVTKRYNRVINRAVMDETCKRFLTKGRADLQEIERGLDDAEKQLNAKALRLLPWDPEHEFDVRTAVFKDLALQALKLSKTMKAENQPMRRLMDSIEIYQKSPKSEDDTLSTQMKALNIARRERNNQVTLRAQLLNIRARELVLSDIFKIIGSNQKSQQSPSTMFPKLSSELTAILRDCRDQITQANEESLFRVVIMATISFSKLAHLNGWYRRTYQDEVELGPDPEEGKSTPKKPEDWSDIARDLLEAALKLCDQLGDCPELREKVQDMGRLYEGPRYEKVTLKELQSIKMAMINGLQGMATNSGHWYNCENGHPFAIGECGMPMEEARCPECRARIGGTNHQTVEGVSRAVEME